MRKYEFLVEFIAGGVEVVYAFCESDAIILARANRINAGLCRNVLNVLLSEEAA